MKKIRLGIVLILSLITFFGCATTKRIETKPPKIVDPITRLGVEFEGFDNYCVVKKIHNKIDYDHKDKVMKKFIDTIEYHFPTDLRFRHNGDTITVKITYDKDYAKKHNIEVKFTQRDVTIAGLYETERIDNETQHGIMIDGVYIPDAWDISYQSMLEHVNGVRAAETQTDFGEDTNYRTNLWETGEGISNKNLKNKRFSSYPDARKYADSSNQMFRIEPIVENEKVSGYEVIFQTE